MVLPPLFQQHLHVRLDQAKRRHDVSVSHPPSRANAEWSARCRQIDHNNGSGLSNMDVRGAMLPRREKNTDLKPVDIQDGRH
jgi:hypothetical protein